jgi:hypothetical protein
MNTNEILNAVGAKLSLSDFAMAREVFHVHYTSLKGWRSRGLPDDKAIKCAELLEINDGVVLAWIQAERSKDDTVKKSWERVAKTLRSAAATIAAVSLLGGFFSPPPANAAPGLVFNIMTSNIHYARLRRWLAALFTLCFVGTATAADFYLGVGYMNLSQDIGLQAQNDTPLDDVSAPDSVDQHGCGPNCIRTGIGSEQQYGRGGNLFFGWRTGRSAIEFGYADLGTWQLMGGVQKADGFTRNVKSNVTMEAVHASFIGYTPRYFGIEAYGRVGFHINRTTARSNYRDYNVNEPEEPSRTTLYELQGTKGGTLFGAGLSYPMASSTIRAEIKRYYKIGVIDLTGQSDVRVVEFSATLPF